MRAALRRPVNHLVLVNPFLPAARREEICKARGLRPHQEVPLVFVADGASPVDEEGEGLVGVQELAPEMLQCHSVELNGAIFGRVVGSRSCLQGFKPLGLCVGHGGEVGL